MEDIKGTDHPRRKRGSLWGRLLFWGISLIVLLVLIALSMPNFCRVRPSAPGSLELVPGMDIKGAQEEGPSYDRSYESARRGEGAVSAPAAVEEKGALTAAGEAVFGTPAYAQTARPKVIYRGSMDVKVKQLKESYDKAVGTLARYGGYLAASSESTETQRQWISLTVRVANEKLNDFLAEVRALGEVLRMDLQSQEVTSEFVDLEARLKQLQASAGRMLALMERSGKLADLLTVERELTQRQTEIEQIQGRLRQLSDQVALATMTVNLYTEAPPPQVTGFIWGFGETLNAAWVSVKVTLRTVAKAVIWLVIYVPIWILILLALWFIWWLLKRWGVFRWVEVEEKEEEDSS